MNANADTLRPISPSPADSDTTASGLGLFWARPEEWREANQTLAGLFRSHAGRLSSVLATAQRARAALEEIFPILDDYAAQTCPGCPAVCCREARVAFDFKDLIFLHANGLEPPPSQLRRYEDESCRYLGPEGCRLERLYRPFVCTWYLCAAMLEIHRLRPPRFQRRFAALVTEAQHCRRTSEDLFTAAVI